MACPHSNEEHSSVDDDAPCLIPNCECVRWVEPMLSFPMNDIGDILCACSCGCRRLMKMGDPVARKIICIDGSEVVCVYCVTDDCVLEAMEQIEFFLPR